MSLSSKIKLMIIDDNSDEREILGSYFSCDEDIDLCGIFSNGLDGLAKVREINPDVILTDFIMPGIDGLGVIESIRKIFPREKSKIIMYSGIGDSRVVSSAFSAGVDYYLMKPISLTYLKRCIINISARDNNLSDVANMRDLRVYDSSQGGMRDVIKSLGIPVNMTGYEYIIEAIEMMLSSEKSILLKEVYSVLAEHNTTSSYCIEMSIRNAIKKAYRYRNNLFITIFKTGCPGNAVFLKTIREYVSVGNATA